VPYRILPRDPDGVGCHRHPGEAHDHPRLSGKHDRIQIDAICEEIEVLLGCSTASGVPIDCKPHAILTILIVLIRLSFLSVIDESTISI
tara:strand:- start:84 stop:350 length:267 start_codon:yes stop_codon:yes gene_type:complete